MIQYSIVIDGVTDGWTYSNKTDELHSIVLFRDKVRLQQDVKIVG